KKLDGARDTYQAVVDEYKDSAFATKAAERLKLFQDEKRFQELQQLYTRIRESLHTPGTPGLAEPVPQRDNDTNKKQARTNLVRISERKNLSGIPEECWRLQEVITGSSCGM